MSSRAHGYLVILTVTTFDACCKTLALVAVVDFVVQDKLLIAVVVPFLEVCLGRLAI